MATPRRELMPASIRLGRVGGILIGLHFSWLIIAVAFIGWFLMIAARASYAEVEIGEALRAIRVSDVMRPIQQLRTVYPDTPVSEALEAMVSDDVQRLAVVRDGHLEGIVSRGQIQALLQSRTELRRAS